MGNPISPQLTKGTFGELLVQLRLLQFDVQAAPPLKDSGNDLIAIRGDAIRCVQVKATEAKERPSWPKRNTKYHLVAFVRIVREDHVLQLDRSHIYLFCREERMARVSQSWGELDRFLLTSQRVDELFREPHVTTHGSN
jgi:hypothetical protein